MRLRWDNVRTNLLYLSLLWILPIGITGYVLGGGPGSPIRPGDPNHTLIFDSDALSSLMSDLLVFLGIAVTVLISVFTGIYVNARNQRNNGYRTIRSAADQMTIIGNNMSTASRSQDNQINEILARFSSRTNDVAASLSEVPPNWDAREGVAILGTDIDTYMSLRKEITSQISQYLARNSEWSAWWRETGICILNVLTGSSEIEEGLVGELFARQLLRIFVSMSALLCLVLLNRLLPTISYGLPATSWSNAFSGAALSLITLTHFMALVLLVLKWLSDWERVARNFRGLMEVLQ